MKNKLILLVMLLVVSMIVSTGCSQTYTLANYKTGTEGVVLEFSASNPKSVYEQEKFGNSVVINNKGSYDVTYANPAKLIITYDTYRLDDSYNNLLGKDANGNIELTNIALQGKSKDSPLGEDHPFDVYFESKDLTHLRESSTTAINYNLCYPYTTELTTMTCIDTATASRNQIVSACKVENYDGAGGQGAPITITKIEPEILLQENSTRPQFKIYIENLGQGYVTNSANCDNTNINDMISSGKVTVHAWLSNKETGKELQCGPEDSNGALRLVDSESYIRCYIPTNMEGYSITKRGYVTPLIVEVKYTYVDIEKQEIEILRNEALTEPVTQGLCESYQVDYNGECQTKCEYCSKHPLADLCQKGKPYAGFSFGANFSCSCTLQKCNEKLSKGSCIKEEYCAGGIYCCSTNQCDDYQVEYNGICIDKCEYCALPNINDTQTCGLSDFTGFTCENIGETTCNQYANTGSCITGYCGGANADKYCASTQKNKKMQQVIADYNAKGMSTCRYCSAVNNTDDICRFTNKGIVGTITPGFGCNCVKSDINKFPSYAIDPEQTHCYGESGGVPNYCCDITKNPGNN